MHYYMTEYGIRFELHLYREASVETSFWLLAWPNWLFKLYLQRQDDWWRFKRLGDSGWRPTKKWESKIKKMRLFRSALKTWFILSSVCKAIAAIYRTIITRFKRNFASFATSCTSGFEHFSVAAISSGIFTSITAGFASLWFICKTFGCIKFLFTCSKFEFGPAVSAN